MNTKYPLITLLQPVYRKAFQCSSLFAVACVIAGGAMVPKVSWADAASDAALPTTEQVAVLESVSVPEEATLQSVSDAAQKPDATEESAAVEAAPMQVTVVGINLKSVRDLDSIVDEARMQAQVKYLAQKLRQSPSAVQQYVELAWEEASRRAGLRPELLIAIMHKESTFQPKVQSRYGAQGLMQVVRRWHREKLHASESLFDPEVNIRVGTDILEEYLDLAQGDLSKALTKYSGNARNYANAVLNESEKLAQVADTAAAEVALAPWLFDETVADQVAEASAVSGA